MKENRNNNGIKIFFVFLYILLGFLYLIGLTIIACLLNNGYSSESSNIRIDYPTEDDPRAKVYPGNSGYCITAGEKSSAAANNDTALNPKVVTVYEDNYDHIFYNEKTGTLKLSGNVTRDEIRNFYDRSNVIFILALRGCNLPQDCSYLFDAYANVRSIDLSDAYTSNVTNMEYMFAEASELEQLDISNFDTSNVVSMKGMFGCCKSLEEIDLTSFDTSNVADMSHMFNTCSSLLSLDLSSFDTSNVKDVSGMFICCTELETVYVSKNWDTGNVMFNVNDPVFNCDQFLTGGKGTVFDPDKKGIGYAHIDKTGDPGYFTHREPEDLDIVPGRVDFDEHTGTLTLSGRITTHQVRKYISGKDNVINVIAADNCVLPKDCSCMFAFSDSIDHIDLSKADASQVNDMSDMFFNCTSLSSADISGLDTSKVFYMRRMFHGCSELSVLKMADIDTSRVVDMNSMFYGCSSLSWLDLSGFDTSNVRNMSYMFCDCTALKKLELSGCDTSNARDMSGMFCNCKALKKLDLSGFDTSHAYDMTDIFFGCDSLETVKFSDFDQTNTMLMGYMFTPEEKTEC